MRNARFKIFGCIAIGVALAFTMTATDTIHSAWRGIAGDEDKPLDSSSGVYSFANSSCPTQGAWTQSALAQTESIISVIEKLKDNPDCKGIGNVVQNLQSATKALALPQTDPDGPDGNTVESLPGEIAALVSAVGRPGSSDTGLLFKKMLQAAQIGSDQASRPGMPTITNESAAIKALYKRTKRATAYGIEAVSQVMNELPAYDRCLIGHPNEAMLLFSATIKTAAAFAGSGEGVGQRLGSAIAGFVNMAREQQFTKILRDLNATQFWYSVSCILEASTKAWCDGRNAQELLQFSKDEYERSSAQFKYGDNDPQADNPLEGYYLTVRELPIVSQWLRTVKLGTDPKNSSDAKFQSDALIALQSYQSGVKTMLGEFSQNKALIETFTETYAKQNTVLMLLQTINADILKGSGSQFYTMAMNGAYIPFYLLGLPDIPEPCRAGNGDRIRAVDPFDWMQTGGPGGKYQPIFNDPEALLVKIEGNLRALIDSANDRASAYFRQRLVIDLQNLVTRTLTGQFLSVRESLEHLNRYLIRFEGRLTGTDDDVTALTLSRDTRSRITHILDSYNEIIRLGRDLKAGNTMTDDEMRKRSESAAQAMIDSVFKEVRVIYLTDVMLPNRLSTIINYDISKRLRDKKEIGEHQRDVLLVAQSQLVEKLVEVHGLNPTSNSIDMSQSQHINQQNFIALERMFSDTMFGMLEELNEVVHGRSASATALYGLAKKRLEADAKARAVIEGPVPGGPVPIFRGWKSFVNWLFPGNALKREHPDLYYRDQNGSRLTAKEDEFGSYGQLWGKLCGQSLAFQERARFAPICKGAVLKSYYAANGEHSPLNLTYDDYLPNAGYDRVIQADPKKISLRMCALNDFNIRNLVHFLEDRDRKEDKEIRVLPSPSPSPSPSMGPDAAPVVDPKKVIQPARSRSNNNSDDDNN